MGGGGLRVEAKKLALPRANPAKWWRTRAVGSAHRSPASMFISPLRRYTSLLVLVFLVSLIGGVWYLTNAKRISRMAQILLSSVFGGEVEVGSGHLSFSGTLQLSGVVLRTSRGTETPVTLFSADYVEMRFDWLSLLGGQLRATQVTAIRPTLNLVEDRPSQRWNYERFDEQHSGSATAAPGVMAALPVIILREARVQWAEVDHTSYELTASTIVDGQLIPDGVYPRMYRFEVDERSEEAGAGSARGGAGRAAGEAPLSQITGTWDTASGRFTAQSNNVLLSPRLARSLPRPVRQWWDEHQLRGRIGQLKISSDAQAGFVVTADFDRVSMVQVLDTTMTGASRPFTIPVTNVAGILQFNADRGAVHIKGLRGDLYGQRFMLDGDLAGNPAEAPFDLTLRVPNLVIGDTYPDIMDASVVTQDFVQRLCPRGKFSVGLTLARPAAGAAVTVRGTVDCHNATMRFAHFPFPLDQVNGHIDFDERLVRFHHVTALGGETTVDMDGVAGVADAVSLIDFTVSSSHAVFDERMAACLAPRYQPVWAAFNPSGTGGFVCHVTREDKPKSPVHTQVVIKPEDVTALYQGFPYPLRHVHGEFTIGDESATVTSLTASAGPDDTAQVHFSGTISYPGGDLEQVDPRIEVQATAVPLDRTLLNALPDAQQIWARQIETTGLLDLRGSIRRGPKAEPEITGSLAITKGSVRLKNTHYALDGLAAQAELTKDRVDIKELTARMGPDGEGRLKLAATIDQSAPETTIHGAGKWSNLRLAARAPELLPGAWAKTWNEVRPAGLMDGDFSVSVRMPERRRGGVAAGKSVRVASVMGAWEHRVIDGWSMFRDVPGVAGGPAGSPLGGAGLVVEDYLVRLHPHEMAVSPVGWPDGLTHVTGEIRLGPGEVVIDELSADTGPLHVATSGTYKAEEHRLDLTLTAKSEALPEKWLGLLPASISSFLVSLKPAGGLDCHLTTLSRRGTGDEARWTFGGDIGVRHFSTQGPFTTTIDHATLSGKGSWQTKAGALDFDGAMVAGDISLAGKIIETFKGEVLASSANKTIAFNEIQGDVAHGKLQGNILVKLEPAPKYEATLLLNDAELAALVLPANATAEERKHLGTARVNANLAVQETFGKQAERTGRGEMSVGGGTIYNVPLAMGLLQLASLRLPVSKAFDTAEMSYYIRDNKVTFERISLESTGVNLVGLGTLSLPNRNLDLRFITESPNELQLPILTPIFRDLRNHIFQLEVVGPIEAPKIQAVPLDAISNTLELLLPRKAQTRP